MKNKNLKAKQENSDPKTPKPRTQKGAEMFSPSDPNGSYTGKPQNKFDRPTQDADDL